MRPNQDNVTIIGGGIIGLCIAWYCRKAGHNVTIIDREEKNTTNCSSGNAGMIVPSHFIPLAAPGVISQGLKWMLDKSSPFYIRPRLNLDLARWCWLFMKKANRGHVNASAELLRDLHLQSRELMIALGKELGVPVIERGLLMLCKTEHALKEETAIAAKAKTLGLRMEVCDPKRLAELDPGIEMNVHGGIWCEQDCHLDPAHLMIRLREELAKKGVQFEHNANIQLQQTNGEVTLKNSGKHPGQLILAAGVWTKNLLAQLGRKLPLEGGKGYSMTLENPAQLPQLCSILCEAKVAVTPMGRNLRVAGTMEICGQDLSINETRVSGITRSFSEYFPAFSPSDFDHTPRWSGLRPCSPDGLPYLGPIEGLQNLTLATGHAMMGLSLAPVTGQIIAGMLDGKEPQLPNPQLLQAGRYS